MGGEKVLIDLGDRQTYGIMAVLALGWGTAFILTLYNIISDVAAARRARKPRPQPRPVRAPCAPDLHEFVEGRCSTCGADEPQP